MPKTLSRKTAFLTLITFTFLLLAQEGLFSGQEDALLKARQLIQKAEFNEAIQFLQNYIARNKGRSAERKNVAEAYYVIAKVYLVIGEEKNCEDNLKLVFRTDPGFTISEPDIEFRERVEKIRAALVPAPKEKIEPKVGEEAKPGAMGTAGKPPKPKKFPWLVVGAAVVVVAVVAIVLAKKGGGPTPPTTTTTTTTTTVPPTTGSISVSSTPTGAKIYLDNTDTGKTTNDTLTSVSAGAHTVKLVKEGYQDYTQSVTVTAGQTATVNATLTKNTITVTSPASGANWMKGTEYTILWTTDSSTNAAGNNNPPFPSIQANLPQPGSSVSDSLKQGEARQDADKAITRNRGRGNQGLLGRDPQSRPREENSQSGRESDKNLLITNVNIDLYKGGAKVLTIASNTTNDSSEKWTVPTAQATGSDYMVRVSCATDASVYGESGTFSIVELPTVTTSAVTNITGTSATSGGNVTADGGATVTARGVCWSTAPNPTTANSKTTDGTGTGVFVSILTNLNTLTTYHVRAYATNSAGTAYGNDVSFTTSGVNPPGLSTSAVTNITATTAVAGGNVTADGGAAVTARGVCWSTALNPTLADAHTIDGSGLGVFVSNITGLNPGTLYHVRAYATNSAGTAYGSDVSFTAGVNPPTVTTTAVSSITATTAVAGGNVTADGGSAVTERGVCWSTALNPTLADSHTHDGSGLGAFTSNLTNLNPGTTYHVRAYATSSSGTGYGSDASFTTATTVPTVTTSAVTNITQTTATSGGNVTAEGGAAVTARGVCWSTNQNPTIADSRTTDGSGTGVFVSNLTNLTPGTAYHVRAYATSSAGTGYGGDVGFTAGVNPPTVTTSAVTNITGTTAIGGGNATADGGATVTARGVCWSANQNPTIADSRTTDGAGLGVFVSNLTNLNPGTLYHVRAYATNSSGTSYGNDVSFTTLDIFPAVTTSAVTNITATTATSGGNVTADNGGPVTERGVCWSIMPNPTKANSRTTDGAGLGVFASNLTNLNPGTTYHVRAYATNSAGTGYGNDVSFTTQPILATVTTNAVTNITGTSAVGGGNVTAEGGADVTDRGVCWSTNQNPTIADSHTHDGIGAGVFTSNLTGLSPATLYYVRAYAMNSAGTGYGNEVSFTAGVNSPTVTTSAVTNITGATATSGGNVTAGGGAPVTERGVCWSTNLNPTIADSHTHDGSGLGVFTSNLTGLSLATAYHVRAYATNSAGTGYGGDEGFATPGATVPTVTTSAVTNDPADTTKTKALGGGDVTAANGSAVTSRGVCWSTTPNPTTAGWQQGSGAGLGVFTVTLISLTPGTTYYVRAYAANNSGTGYGNEVVFPFVTAPNVTTTAPTNKTARSADSGGNVTNACGAPVTERGVCWSTTTDPTLADSHTHDGSGTGVFTSNITGLSPATTYYVRAYATNSAGTDYGSNLSFRTEEDVPTLTTSAVTNDPTDTTKSRALGGGNVTAENGSAVTSRGVCWSTAPNPTTAGWQQGSGAGLGVFTVTLISLTPGTTYYVRAYAANNSGPGYGNEVVFPFVTAPNVTTSAVTNNTGTAAVSGGNVTDACGAAVTERGVCWSTSQNPTIADPHTLDGAGTGVFTSNITGLTPTTTYYVRAYATNSAGTDYGSNVGFVANPIPPTVTTTAVTNITTTTATSGGNVTSDGGLTVTSRGVCWNTTGNPISADPHTWDGNGTGAFTSAIIGLSPSTTYYVRAYAANNIGTAYGNQITFTTPASPLPVTASAVTNAIANNTGTTAVSGGNTAAGNGAAKAEGGAFWTTDQDPTFAGPQTHDGRETQIIASNFVGFLWEGLPPPRACAINPAETNCRSGPIIKTESFIFNEIFRDQSRV